MKKVYLDGKEVDVSIITAEKHKYIGMFRPAEFSQLCPICGLLQTNLQVHDCYTMGHFDIPQYQTL